MQDRRVNIQGADASRSVMEAKEKNRAARSASYICSNSRKKWEKSVTLNQKKVTQSNKVESVIRIFRITANMMLLILLLVLAEMSDIAAPEGWTNNGID